MKPKHSTGYLTPQASKSKIINRRNSEAKDDLNMAKEINDSLFEKLMNCPIKRQLVLKIISSEKDKIEEYKRKEAKQQIRNIGNASPLSKVQKRFQCESPTALLRRRALEQQSRQSPISDAHSDDNGNSSCSGQSVDSSNPSPVPFDKLLDGVIAYVEIKSRDQDRSNGAKALMQSMGATVRSQFTKDVTHVVFKDGSFTTYQKAKLMKVHLVSVLWIEAVRSTKTRVSEKKFPALGTEAYDHNVSTLCSQMQKDYEDIIRDELRRSLATGTPLPSTKFLIDRRRTIMTPMTSSFKMFSQEFPSSQDREVENILHSGRQSRLFEKEPVESRLSPELTSDDDSDLGPIIDGSIVRRKKHLGIHSLESQIVINSVDNLGDYIEPNMDCTHAGKSGILRNDILPNRTPQKTKFCDSSMDLTLLDRHLIIDDSISNSLKENETPNISDNSIYNKKTPKLVRKNITQTNETPRRSGDNLFNVPDDNLYKRRTRQLKNTVDMSSDNSVNITKDCILNNKSDSTSNMSSLKLTHQSDIQIISKNTCTNPMGAQDDQMKKPDNVTDKSSSTNMSSLHISSASSKENNAATICNKEINDIEKTTSTNMSALLITSDSSNNKSIDKSEPKTTQKRSFNSSTDKSFSPLNSNLMKEVMRVLGDSPLPDANVTKRRGRQSTLLRNPYNTRRKSLFVDCKSTDNDRESKVDSKESISPSKTSRESTNSREDVPQTRKKSHCSGDEGKSKRRNHKQMNETATDDEKNVSDGSEKKNKMRKLYNPDDALKGVDLDSDEKERSSQRQKAKKRKSDEGVFLNPNIITVAPNILITAKAKEFIDKNRLDIQALLNKESEESEEEKTLSKRKKKNTNKKRNSDADEQKELADEFSNIKKARRTNKKVDKTAEESGGGTKRRQSARLLKLPRKKLNLNSSTSSNDEKIPVINRRSTMEFQTVSQLSAKKKLKIDKNKRPSIVCTKLHKEDIQVFNQIVRKLGGFVIEDEVSSKTTHVVAGEPKRTINMLRAIARGCWVLKYEWLLKSLEERKWLPEEDYEEVDFSPSVQQCRLQRQAFGPSFSLDIFQNCGPIYIAKGSTPRCSDLRELVSLCKGNVVTIPRNASVIVGEYARYEGVKCVSEAWVLDSITFNKKMPFKKYIIATGVNSPTV